MGNLQVYYLFVSPRFETRLYGFNSLFFFNLLQFCLIFDSKTLFSSYERVDNNNVLSVMTIFLVGISCLSIFLNLQIKVFR